MDLEAPSGFEPEMEVCSRRGTKPQIIADDCRPPAIQGYGISAHRKGPQKTAETAANGTNNGTKVTPPRRPDRTQPMGSVQAQSAGRRQRRNRQPHDLLDTSRQRRLCGKHNGRLSRPITCPPPRDDALSNCIALHGRRRGKGVNHRAATPAPESEWTAAPSTSFNRSFMLVKPSPRRLMGS